MYNVVVSSTRRRTKTVRAQGVQNWLGNDALKKELGRYGQVLSAHRERYLKNKVFKETVLAIMELRDIMMKGVRIPIWCSHQPKTCRFCASADHMVEQCPKKTAKTSYASVLSVKIQASGRQVTKTMAIPAKTTTSPSLESRVNSKATEDNRNVSVEADREGGQR